MRGITDAERRLLTHISHFGSDGYPIYKCGRHWSWGSLPGVPGPPTVFQRRRDAVESFERFLDVLRDAVAGRI